MGFFDKALRALCFGHAGRDPGVKTSEGIRGSSVELEQQARGPLTDSASQHAVLLEVAHPTPPAPATHAAAAALGDTKAPVKAGIDQSEQQELASTASNLLATKSSSPRPLNMSARPSPVSRPLSINSAEPAAGVIIVANSHPNELKAIGSAVPKALQIQAGSKGSELQEPEPPCSAPAAEGSRLRRHMSEPAQEILPADDDPDTTSAEEGPPCGDDGNATAAGQRQQQQRSKAQEHPAAEPTAGSQPLRTQEPRSRRQRQRLSSALAVGGEVSRPLARLQQLAARDGPRLGRSPAHVARKAPAVLLVPVYGSGPRGQASANCSAGAPGDGLHAEYSAAASPPADPGALLQKLALYFGQQTHVADGENGCDGVSTCGAAQDEGLLGLSSACAGGGAATPPHDASQLPRQQQTPRSAGNEAMASLSHTSGHTPGSRARSASAGSNFQPQPCEQSCPPAGAGARRLYCQPGACKPNARPRVRRAATWQALGSPTPAASRDPKSWSMTSKQPANGIESIGMILKLHRLCHVIEPRPGPGPRPPRGTQGSQGPAKHTSPLRGRSAAVLGTTAPPRADSSSVRQLRSGSLGNQS